MRLNIDEYQYNFFQFKRLFERNDTFMVCFTVPENTKSWSVPELYIYYYPNYKNIHPSRRIFPIPMLQ